MKEFLHLLQLRHRKRATLVSIKNKRQLDNTVLEAIVSDGRSFHDFEKRNSQIFETSTARVS